MASFSIATRRTILRPLEAADTTQLFDAVSESRTELSTWLDWCRHGYTLDDAARWISLSSRAASLKTSLNLGIFDTEDNDLIGSVGLSAIDGATSTANLGYWIRSRMTNRGFAREAATAMIHHAQRTIGITRIEIVVHPLNARSAGLALALGAQDEGIVPSRLVYRGSTVAARVFSLRQARPQDQP